MSVACATVQWTYVDAWERGEIPFHTEALHPEERSLTHTSEPDTPGKALSSGWHRGAQPLVALFT